MIVYIGNQLAPRGLNPTSVDFLGDYLQTLMPVKRASAKRFFVTRLVDMAFTIFKFRKQAKLVLIDTYSTKAFYFAVICAKLCRILDLHYVPILHGGGLPKRFSKSAGLSSKLITNAHYVVSPSSYLADACITAFNRACLVIENPIKLDDYQPVNKPQTDAITILWLRALQDIYNPLMAVSAVEELVKTGAQNVVLHMVGPDKGNLHAQLSKLVKERGLEEHVIFHGRQSKNDWLNIAQSCTVFLNTSNVDNTPVSVLEALALNLPVISTNPDGIKHLLKHNQDALLVNIKDHKGAAAALLEVSNNPNLRSKLIENGRKTVENYSWTNIQTKWLNLING